MAHVVQSPQKYHPHEWKQSNHLQYVTAENERSAAERLRDESERVLQETQARTEKAQADVNMKLSQRIRDVHFWKSEVEGKIEEISKEIESLSSSKEQLEFALQASQTPLEVTRCCLSYRENRKAIDLVHDDVEIQLMKEVEVIDGIQGLLHQTLDQTTEQIRILRSCKYKLEKDFADKISAHQIDRNTLGGQDTSGIPATMVPNPKAVDSKCITPDQWENFSNQNILKAEKERNASSMLRGVICGVLDQTKQDMLRQRAVVDQSFEQRIAETQEAKDSLEDHLTKVDVDISAMETNISALQEGLQNKEEPMAYAHSRINQRRQRPNVELVHDPPQKRLIQEVGEITESIDQLKQKLSESQSALKALLRRQLALKEDVEIKNDSLHIDRDCCMALRYQKLN